ncbi:MAG: hypothetical protein HY863_00115, partial [Chloroflexi bacterium]|nr:hypothetical protein [Chloroflexota bacterium]
MDKKTISYILIGTGAVLLIGAGIFFLDSLTAAEPVGLGKWVFDILGLALGAGASFKGWKDVLKKDVPAAPSTRIIAMDDAQVATGENGRIINQGDNSNNFEHVEHYHEASKTNEIHDSIGYIPAVKVKTYVHRGKTEDDVIDFLQKGGIGAIVGLHAPGGLGKTELSKKACEVVRTHYEGILWVDVGKNTPAQVVINMLNQCGVQLPPNTDDEIRKNELRAYLQTRRLLVILDDVHKEALRSLDDFLPPKPCSCLITSRIQQMSGINQIFALDHMTVEESRELMRAILGDDAVERELTMADKLAERVAWNPLALEIAARRALQSGVSKPIAHYFETAKNKFPELQMDGDERWDMRKVFDISYLDLSPEDQKRFRALAVFHSTGFAPKAVGALWELDETETNKVLNRFVNLSLVKPVLLENIARLRFHDLLDEYAALLLHESAEGEGTYSTLADWLIQLFDEHYTDDFSNAPEVGLEFANLAKTAEWAIENRKGTMLAALATKPRNWLYNYFRRLNDWLRWLETSLKIGVEDNRLQANVLQAIGDVLQFRKELDGALVSYNEALKLFKDIGDKLGEANVLQAIGDVLQFRDDRDGAP